MKKLALATPVAAAFLTATILSHVTDAQAKPAPAHTCKAQVILAEDGSWTSAGLFYDHKLVDAHWDENMPQYGWRPSYKGIACPITLVQE